MSSDLQARAELELGRRMRVGAVTHVLCAAVVGLLTPVRHDSPLVYWCFLVLVTSCCAVRIALVELQPRWYPTHRERWNRWMTFTLATTAFLWGVFSAFVFDVYGLVGRTPALIFLLGSGIAGAGAVTLGPDRRRAGQFVTCVLMIPGLVLLSRESWQGLGFGSVFLVYLLFLLSQIAVQGRQYWEVIRSREAFAETATRLENVLDAIPGYVSWLGPDLRYRGMNQNLARALDAEGASLVGARLGTLMPGSHFVEAVTAFSRGDLRSDTREILLRTPLGERWHLLTMRKAGAEIYLVAVDGHALKTAERALTIERARSEFAGKMAALGEMASGVAHEINNPLAIVAGCAENLRVLSEREKLTSEKTRELASRIERTSMRIGRIVRGLLAFARHDDGEPFQDAPISNIVDETLELCRERFRMQGITLEVGEIPPTWTVPCRATQISQVIANLLNNAYDAVAGAETKLVRLEVRADAEWIEISVVDSGPGVPVDIRDRIMEPFFTTKEVGKGTGLGLSIARGIAESHRGQFLLDLSSERTRFVLRLRRHFEDDAKKAA